MPKHYFYYDLFLLTILLTPNVWIYSWHRSILWLTNFTKCPTIDFNSDTNYLDLASDPLG